MSDRFQIVRRLGEGAMGVVYEALDRSRNHRVALKTLSRAEPASIYYLKNEFRALADVLHPNLVALHELFAEGETWFFTMDLIDGVPFILHARGTHDSASPTLTMLPDMDTALSDGEEGRPSAGGSSARGHLDEPVLRDAMAQLVNGVQAIHDAGKLHRDLKPSNVLVTRDGRVKILDFGLVSGVAPGSAGGTVVGEILGTPAYMAPEQARGDRATEASDWYAVGVMLYQALTGRLPFEGRPYEVLYAKQQHLPPRPRHIDEKLPDDLEDLCIRLLQLDAEGRPSGPEILARLGSGPSTSARVPPVDTSQRSAPEHAMPSVFVGRQKELEELERALDDTDDGRAVLVQLHAVSGMGKTALLKQFVDAAGHGHGAVVLESRCYERESVPYKGLDGIIDALTRHMRRLTAVEAARLLPRNIHALARLFPVLQRVEAVASAPHRRGLPPDPTELRRRAIAGLRELLERIAEQAPLVLCIDDFQWADLDSVAMLREVLTWSDPPPCLFVVAYRSDEVEHSEALRALASVLSEGSFEVRSMELASLDASEVSELAQRLARSSSLNVHRLWLESQGNPYFVHELVRRAPPAASGDDEPIGSGRLRLNDAIRTRVAELDDHARGFLQLLAIAGRPMPARVLAEPLGIVDEMTCIRRLRAGGFARTSGSGLIESYHDRIRQAVLDGLSPEAHRSLHARLAASLESGRADPQVIVEHYRAAGDGRKTLDHAIPAAERAWEALAFDRAARFYRIASDLAAEHRPEEAAGLEQKLAAALINAGRPMEAASVYERSAARLEGGEAARVRSLAAAQKLIAGDLERGIAGIKASLEAYGVVIPKTPFEQIQAANATFDGLERSASDFAAAPRWRGEEELSHEERARADLIYAAQIGLIGYDLSPLVRFLNAQSQLAALETREPMRVLRSFSLGTYGTRSNGLEPHPSIMRVLELSGTEVATPIAGAWRSFGEGGAAHLAMDSPRAVDALREAEETFSNHCHGVTRELSFVRLMLGGNLWTSGRVRERARCCEQWERGARERGEIFLELWMKIEGCKDLCADEPDRARQEMEGALTRLGTLSGVDPSQSIVGVVQMVATFALADLDLYSGRPQHAWARMKAFGEEWARAPLIAWVPLHRNLLKMEQAYALAALAGSDEWQGELESSTRALADELAASGHPMLSAVALQLRAALDMRRARFNDVIAQLEAAAVLGETWSPEQYHCVRRQLGRLRGGTDGAKLIQAADEALRAEGIENPERWANMRVPGFS